MVRRSVQAPPRIRVSTMDDIASFLKKERKVKAVKPKKIILRRVKRTYSKKQKLYVIYLRYGSNFEFENIQMSWVDISRLTGIHSATCLAITKAFHQKGNRIESSSKPGPHIQPLPPDVLEYLKASLNENKFLSLRQRVQIIKQQLNFPISLKRLWLSYKRLGIKYRAAESVMQHTQTPSLMNQRAKFYRKISSLLA